MLEKAFQLFILMYINIWTGLTAKLQRLICQIKNLGVMYMLNLFLLITRRHFNINFRFINVCILILYMIVFLFNSLCIIYYVSYKCNTSVNIHYTCTLCMYIIHVHYTCTLYMYIIHVIH